MRGREEPAEDVGERETHDEEMTRDRDEKRHTSRDGLRDRGKEAEREILPGRLWYQRLEQSPAMVAAMSPSPSLWLDVLDESHVRPEPWCSPARWGK